MQKFQDGYTTRDVARLDEFMQLFAQEEGFKMIGSGASKRAENEWFEGLDRVRHIIEILGLCLWTAESNGSHI